MAALVVLGETEDAAEEVVSGKMSAVMYFEARSISSNKRKLEFNYPLRVDFNIESNRWSLFNDELNILISGNTFVEAWSNFQEDFIYLYDEFINTNDKLTPKAESIRDKFKSLISPEPKLCPYCGAKIGNPHSNDCDGLQNGN